MYRDGAPEVLIVMPCGFHMDKAAEKAQHLSSLPGWAEPPAVRSGRVFVVDANSYFARPRPRIVEGTELLAHLFHPAQFECKDPRGAFRKLESRSNSEGSRLFLSRVS